PGSDRANNAPYVIRDGVAGAVLSSPQVNQRVAPSGGTSDGGRPFSNLGTVTITGNTLVIELSNTATNGVIIADAFRVERITAAPSVPQIEVKDGAATLLDNGTLNFGSATQGGAALTKTVTVKNTGAADLILQPIVVGGTGFSLVSANFTPGQTLAPGASVNITVQLSTATAGTFNGTLSFGHNDGGPFDLSLNGTINVAQPAGVYLIDDGDSGFSVSGSWSNVAGYGYGSDAKAATGSDGTKIATWNFTGLAAGNYRISATWLPGSDRANNAAYTFKDGVNPAGSATVNQKVAPAGGPVVSGGRPFSDIGTVTVTGSTLVIQLTNSTGTNGLIIADAIRIELLPAARPAIPRFVATSHSSTSTGAGDSQPTAFSTAAPIIVVSRTAKLFSDEAVPTPKTTAANTLARLLKKPK
ncbi:MAG TPA: choice-of-anchor D domain-containing protein, partial [Planctomycetaceae bacterium]|nr:choice-of-anchor D domain-containing protein [Planctomycetaceae bacterium]